MFRFLRPASLALLLSTGAAAAEVPEVVTDILPIHSLAAAVMEGVGTPALMVPPGASPHGYSMKPSQAAALERADLVFWVGENLTPWLEHPIDSLADDATVVELLALDGTVRHAFRNLDDANADEHEHEEKGHEDEHDHGGLDPHAWMDPANGIYWLGVIAQSLSELDPVNAARYQANAQTTRARIEAVHKENSALLEGAEGLKYVVFHDAYQYFEQVHGLAPAGTIRESDAALPGPAHVAEIRDTIRESQISCIFSEPQFSAELIATITEGAQVKVAMLDPLGTAQDQGPALYPGLLKAMGEAVASCR